MKDKGNSSNYMLKILTKLKLKPAEKEHELSDYMKEAINCFNEDFSTQLCPENFKDIKSLDQLEAKMPELNTTQQNKLRSYVQGALWLYDYGKSVSSFNLSVAPAAQMLVANLVSLNIIKNKSDEDAIAKVLKEKWQALFPPEDDKIEEHLFSTFQAVVASLNLSQKNLNDAKRLINRVFLDRNAGAEYNKEVFKYTLKDVLGFALQQYKDFHPMISQARHKDVAALQKILDDHQEEWSPGSDHRLKQAFRNYFKSSEFKSDFGSHLKSLCEGAIEHYDANKELGSVRRELRTKDYKPEADKDSSTHVFAIHGLDDSLKTWDVLAQEWRGKGCTVHTYDQAGMGLDELRSKNSSLNLDQMHYDFYQKLKRVLTGPPKPKKLIITGHSLGGALVLNSMQTIKELGTATGVTIEVSLITPAAMTAKTVLASTWAEDISPEAKQLRGIGPSRQGAIKIWTQIYQFIRFVGRAAENLIHNKSDGSIHVPLQVIQADEDKKVKNIPVMADETLIHASHNPHQEYKKAQQIVETQFPTPKT